MEETTHFRARILENSMTLGRLLLASWATTLAFMSATLLITHYLQIPSSFFGLGGVLFGCTTYYIVDGTNVRRLSVGVLGFIASTTIVIDITGQFFVLDGSAHVLAMFGMMLPLSVIFDAISVKNARITGIRYFFVGCFCIGVAAIGLYLEWVLGSEAIGTIAREQQALLLFSGLGVCIVGLRIWDVADSAVPERSAEP